MKFQPISRCRSWLTHARAERFQPEVLESEGPIVSLTSIPERFHLLGYVLKSLLWQKRRPSSIQLWIAVGTRNKIPKEVDELTSFGVVITEVDDVGPHTKLLPALKAFPESAVITADDDIIYPPDWLEKLVKGAETAPESIHCLRALKIGGSGAEFFPYQEWEAVRHHESGTEKGLLPLGYGGVFYPPKAFSEEVFDIAALKECCPKADDLWWKVMSHRNGTSSFKVPDSFRGIVYVKDSQSVGLKYENCLVGTKNDDQWAQLVSRYSLNVEDFSRSN
ncbi:MAG: glycosyltransferase family A protein [Verrucomicrobiota bacterium]